jgi:uncharacterized repeat protein (TIGR03803 family)
MTIPLASAQGPNFTESVVYSFTNGPDGANPEAGLVQDSAGNLFGTTIGGGTLGFGTVFEVDSLGDETVLYSFTAGTDGAAPSAGVILDGKGNLFGTTRDGGNPACGCGVVYKLDTNNNFTVLHTFTGAPDGATPYAGLIRDSKGNLYGTTAYGGKYDYGTVFTVTGAGTQLLHSFSGPDGAHPFGGLVRDSNGNLFGTTFDGGASGFGTVFKVAAAGNESVLHNFTGYADGSNPYASLIRDFAGNLYGTTGFGTAYGFGTVFKLARQNHYTLLHTFTGSPDGANPYVGLVGDTAGNLYGTTYAGGTKGSWGLVFRLDTTGKYSILHTFAQIPDGANPYGSLIVDSSGTLYGTTYQGGSPGCGSGCGVVFKLTPQ